MGWASGSILAEEIWDLFYEFVPKRRRQDVARELVELFEGHDCDTLQGAEELWRDAGLDEEEEDDE